MTPGTKKKDTILLVDDDPDFLELTAENLSPDGYRVITAKTSREAIQAVKDHDISLVITDLRLRRSSGMTLMKNIRKKNPELKVIMMTAYTDPETYLQAIDEGAFDYFHKPFDFETFRKIIKKALNA